MVLVCNSSFQSSSANVLLVVREPRALYITDLGAAEELKKYASVFLRYLPVEANEIQIHMKLSQSTRITLIIEHQTLMQS